MCRTRAAALAIWGYDWLHGVFKILFWIALPLGHDPIEAARRAAASAALVVSCSGVEAALRLATPKV